MEKTPAPELSKEQKDFLDAIKLLQDNPEFAQNIMANLNGGTKKEQIDVLEMFKNVNLGEISSVPEESKGDFENEECENLNGKSAEKSWDQPKVSVKSSQLARTDKNVSYSKTQTEFRDSKDVLDAKLKFVANKMKKAKKVVIYSGAGISTASGIADVASKNKVVAKNSMNRLQAQPTWAHHAIAAMYRKNFVHHCVTQNHDGLAQKAGMPLADVNEIHGGWFDKYNIVKSYECELDPKKLQQLHKWQEEADVVIACGSTLSGLNADSIAEEAGTNPNKTLIILNNQETRLHGSAQINIFCDINYAFVNLAKKLNVPIAKNPRVYEPAEFIEQRPGQKGKK